MKETTLSEAVIRIFKFQVDKEWKEMDWAVLSLMKEKTIATFLIIRCLQSASKRFLEEATHEGWIRGFRQLEVKKLWKGMWQVDAEILDTDGYYQHVTLSINELCVR